LACLSAAACSSAHYQLFQPLDLSGTDLSGPSGPPDLSPALTQLQMSLASLVNVDLRSYTGGTAYPIAPTTIMVGGVSFDLAPLGTSTTSLGAVQMGATSVFVIPANVVRPQAAYTLMNSSFGALGSDIATIEFKGSSGADVKVELVEGTNIRDHHQGAFCNVIPTGTPSASFGSDRLDMQTFDLSGSFAADDLTQIILTSHGTTGTSGTGLAFISAATVVH
jgi:hypothetical protein